MRKCRNFKIFSSLGNGTCYQRRSKETLMVRRRDKKRERAEKRECDKVKTKCRKNLDIVSMMIRSSGYKCYKKERKK